MGLKACPLCFYQRSFAMGVVAVLFVGLLTAKKHWCVLNLLALPLAVAGFGVAVFHVYLELSGKLECPSGVLGLGTAPQQSLAVFGVLLAVIAFGVARDHISDAPQSVAAIGGVVLGVLLAVGCIVSAPPLPPTPTKPYDAAMDMCRPPYRAP